MFFSVITAASRPQATLQRLVEQFQAQTFTDFEHIVVYDGPPPSDVKEYFDAIAEEDERFRFAWLEEPDRRSGTAPRNHGIDLARGRFIVFADDDDLYHPDYLRAFHDVRPDDKTLAVVRMNNYGAVVPRHRIRDFPQWGHVGTPSCAFPARWFRESPELRWGYDGNNDHDFRLVKQCVEQFRPRIKLNPRVLVKAANTLIVSEHGITGAAREQYLQWNRSAWWERLLSPSRSDAWLSRKLYALLCQLTARDAMQKRGPKRT